MIQVSKKLLPLLLIAVTTQINAATLRENMSILSSSLSTVMNSNDVGKIHHELLQMRTAAEDAKKNTPPSLIGQSPNSVQFKDFRSGLDLLVTQIDKADVFAKKNQLERARSEAAKLGDIAQKYHRLYKR